MPERTASTIQEEWTLAQDKKRTIEAVVCIAFFWFVIVLVLSPPQRTVLVLVIDSKSVFTPVLI